MPELKHKKTSVTMTFLSEQYPKGKSYTFNNLVKDVSVDQINQIESAVNNLIEGSNASVEIHTTEALVEE
jgi:hypothetical protein